MANQLLIYDNQIDSATLSGGSWETTLPLTNVQTSVIRKVARTTDALAASSVVTIDLGANYTYFQALCLVGHNLELDAQWRITTSNVSNFSVLVSDTGWVDIYPAIWSSLSLRWEDSNFWSGTARLEDIEQYIRNTYYLWSDVIEARYVKIEISDTGNSNGYIQVGRVVLGNKVEYTRNPDWGASLKWQDDSNVSTALGGTRYFNVKDKRRVYTFSLSEMTDSEAMSYAFEMQRIIGVTGEIFVIPDYEDTQNTFRRSFLGRLTELNGIDRHVYGHQQTAFTVEEII